MMRRLLTALCLGTACLAAGASAGVLEFSPAKGGGIAYAGGAYADTAFEDVPYVSADFLKDLFAGAPRWEPTAQQLRLKGPLGREWAFTIDNPFVSIQGEVFNLTYPVRRGPERVYLPLQPLLRLLREHFGLDVRPVGAAGISSPGASNEAAAPVDSPVASANGVVTGFSLEEGADETNLRIQADPGAEWQGFLARPHFIVRAIGATLDPAAPRRLTGKGRVEMAEARQEKTLVQFTVRLHNPRDSVALIPDPEGYRIRIIPPSSDTAPKKSGGVIILDAGHGGKDRGATVKGAVEADITLAVALQLRDELTDLGYTVHMTREDDVFKTLPERPRFASDNKGDVFVSLHCNSLPLKADRRGTSGFTAYILREGESDEDKALARRENQAIEEQSGKSKKTEISPVDWILLEHQLNVYSKQSEALTEDIVQNFAGFDIPKYSTGARQAGFFVLVGAYMPAVLFEMGFLTHDGDRRVLTSGPGQKEIAKRMAKAIDQFERQRQ